MTAAQARTPSARAARLLVRLRYAIIVFWLAVTVAAVLLLPTLREAQVGSLGDLVPTDANALAAELRSAELFQFPLLSRTLIVQRDPDGLSAAAQGRVVRRAVALNRGELPGLTGIAGALPFTNALGRPPFSRERSTTGITYLFFPTDIGQVGRSGLAERLVERHVTGVGDGRVSITGAVPARAEQREVIEDSLPLVELATVAVVALAVGLHFRALGPAFLTIAAVAVSYLISIRAMALIGQRVGISVPSEIEPVVVVLLFGVVTDYSIFFLSRFRRALGEGESPQPAAERTARDLLPIIVTAGLTVAGGSAALVVANLGFFQAFGPGMAMAVLIGLAVAITFIPAGLAVAGARLFWPRAAGADPVRTDDERDSRTVRLATRRPWLVTVGCAALLLGAASGLSDVRLGNPLIRGLPEESEVRRGYRDARAGFAAGILSPTVVIVERHGIASLRGPLARLERLLAEQPGVAAVVGPREQPIGRPFGAVLSRTGNAARFFLVLESDPLGGRGIRRIQALERRLPELLRRTGLGGAGASLAGDTALASEVVSGTVDDIGRIAPAALAVILIVLVVFLRALVAPLYLLAASVLALAASLGLTVYVFQDLLGHGELTYYVPFAASVLLVALGSDYNVFLVGRIWQEARELPLRRAVTMAASRATTSITLAGIVLAVSFALLAIVPIRPFRELAFAMSIGLLIDALLVRTVLVPALVTIAGERSAWPGRAIRTRRRPRRP